MRTFKIAVSNGASYEIEAKGFDDAAAKILCEPARYPLPAEAVVGIENPARFTRFYKRRPDGNNLWPISARTAELELSILEQGQ